MPKKSPSPKKDKKSKPGSKEGKRGEGKEADAKPDNAVIRAHFALFDPEGTNLINESCVCLVAPLQRPQPDASPPLPLRRFRVRVRARASQYPRSPRTAGACAPTFPRSLCTLQGRRHIVSLAAHLRARGRP